MKRTEPKYYYEKIGDAYVEIINDELTANQVDALTHAERDLQGFYRVMDEKTMPANEQTRTIILESVAQSLKQLRSAFPFLLMEDETMACVEYECRSCKHFWSNNQPLAPEGCPKCGSQNVRKDFDEDDDDR